MGLKEDLFENTNPDFDAAFVIKEDGSLTITPAAAAVTITGHHQTLVYNDPDGNPEQSVNVEYDAVISDPLNMYSESDFRYIGPAEVSGTTPDDYPMGLKESLFENTNPNFNVTFNVTDGSLTIEKIKIIVDLHGGTYARSEYSPRSVLDSISAKYVNAFDNDDVFRPRNPSEYVGNNRGSIAFEVKLNNNTGFHVEVYVPDPNPNDNNPVSISADVVLSNYGNILEVNCINSIVSFE